MRAWPIISARTRTMHDDAGVDNTRRSSSSQSLPGWRAIPAAVKVVSHLTALLLAGSGGSAGTTGAFPYNP